MKKEELPAAIFDLLSSKEYKDLGEDEKNLVDGHLTKVEYNSLKNTVFDFLEIDEQTKIEPRPFLVPKQRKTSFAELLNYPIPAYQVAACLIFLSGLYFLTKPPLNNQESHSVNSLAIDTTGISVADDVYPEDLIFKL